MAVEIERKFLVEGSPELVGTKVGDFLQAYIASGSAAVRVRISDTAAKLTVKASTPGRSRLEFEYDIPREDALAMAGMPGVASLSKTRYAIVVEGFTFELDVYHGPLQGLMTVEIELADENQDFPRPDWLGVEVTDDKRFSNESLAQQGLPFTY